MCHDTNIPETRSKLNRWNLCLTNLPILRRVIKLQVSSVRRMTAGVECLTSGVEGGATGRGRHMKLTRLDLILGGDVKSLAPNPRMS